MTALSGRGIAAPIAAISITGFATSISFPLFALSLERMGASHLEIGVNAAAPAVAMLIGVPLMPAIVSRIGLPRLLIIASLLIAIPILTLRLVPDIAVWTALRAVIGLGVAAAFFGSELWIVAGAPPARRGLLIGIYGTVLALGFLAGPAALQHMQIDSWAPFVACAGAALLAMIPVARAWHDAPQGLGGPPRPIRECFAYFRTDPTIMAAVCMFGAIESGAFALLPLWGLGVGMTERAAIGLVVWIAFGNLALQIPLGIAADRMNRRMMIIAAGAVCALGAWGIAALADGGVGLILVVTLVGGMAVALYSVSLAELGARYEGEALSRATAGFLFAYGVGALLAPPAMGAMADAFPPHGMLWVLGAAGAGVAILAGLRAIARSPG
jgi:MFS family permease